MSRLFDQTKYCTATKQLICHFLKLNSQREIQNVTSRFTLQTNAAALTILLPCLDTTHLYLRLDLPGQKTSRIKTLEVFCTPSKT